MLSSLDHFAGRATADLSMTRVGSRNLIRFGSHDLAGYAHTSRNFQDHPAVLPLNLRMASGLAMGLSASFPPGFRPRPGTLPPMHPAASILHGRTPARTPRSRLRTASSTVVEIAGWVAIAKSAARGGLGWF